jgi:hypothetical protein
VSWLGVDVAGDNQNISLMRYPTWAASGHCFGWVEFIRGTLAVKDAPAHLSAMRSAGYRAAGYINISHGDTAAQMRRFLALAPATDWPDMLDVEELTLQEPDVRAACDVHDATGRVLVIYTGYWNWRAIVPEAARPYYKKYKVVIGSYPHDTPADQPVPMDEASIVRRSAPPATFNPPTPGPWTVADVLSWQYSGQGSLPDYAGFLDLHLLNPAIDLPTGNAPMTVTIVTHGPKLGIHSIRPGTTIPLVRQAVAAGWHWPLVKILHDASVCVDVKAISPQTLTICRYMPPSMDDEGLQNVDQWTWAKKQDWARRMIDLIFSRTPAGQMSAVDYWDVTNEPGAHGVDYYHALGMAFCMLVEEADRRGVHLSLPALPQGVPEWAEMVALVDTGLFGLMKKGGHIFDVHEGVFTDQAIDFGFGDVIPGAQPVSGAGSTNFRHRYLYSLLAARGEIVPLVISEFYGGGRYSNPPADQLARFAWYDARARQEPYLLAFCPFTINPDGGWQAQDYGPTYASAELWAYIAAEKDKPNGDDNMPQPLYHARALIDLTLRNPDGTPATDPLAAPPAAPGLAGVVKKDTLLHVFSENVTAGGYSNRAAVTPDGKSVWAAATALQKL